MRGVAALWHRGADLAGGRGGPSQGWQRQGGRVHAGAAEHLLRRGPWRITETQRLDHPHLLEEGRLQAGFIPAVTNACTFQSPPFNVLLGGGSTGEACLPRAKSCRRT